MLDDMDEDEENPAFVHRTNMGGPMTGADLKNIRQGP